jgi:TrmH family RNA methyltransferase
LMEKHIHSPQNPLVKETVLLLEKSRERKAKGLFVAEGLNELRLCIGAGYKVQKLFFCEQDIGRGELLETLQMNAEQVQTVSVSPEVMKKIAYREGVKNAVAVAEARKHELKDLKLPGNALVVVAEAVEKPGNLGALLRSADAAGADALILCNPGTDVYNPNVIRSSVGCLFTLSLAVATAEETTTFLSEKGFQVFTTFMDNAETAWNADFKQATALVIGTESGGLSKEWRKPNFKNINIPMFGKVDSLNVSAAAAVLMFEAARQRRGGNFAV